MGSIKKIFGYEKINKITLKDNIENTEKTDVTK